MATTKRQLWRRLSNSNNLFLIAGPCVIESEALCLKVARTLSKTCDQLGVTYVFKASYDKANRTSGKSRRGPGLQEGLRIIKTVREKVGVPVLTDVHDVAQSTSVAEVVDIIQIPAFLCRQTDLITAAVKTSAIVNLKKGQFLSPQEMSQVILKAEAAGGKMMMLTERGTTFGYNNLVSDMRAIPVMKQSGYPVVFDATHSVQTPGGQGDKSGGQGEFAPILARAAVAAGVNGLFIETHPNPDKAWSDGPNMILLPKMKPLLQQLVKIHKAAK